MKTVQRLLVIFLPALLFIICCEKEPEINPNEPVDIPDQAFLNALIELGIDTNGDSIITSAEAELVTVLRVDEREITSMSGLESFTRLDTLSCCINNIAHLDVSTNTELRYLNCSHNQISNLDLSKNAKLRILYCR